MNPGRNTQATDSSPKTVGFELLEHYQSLRFLPLAVCDAPFEVRHESGRRDMSSPSLVSILQRWNTGCRVFSAAHERSAAQRGSRADGRSAWLTSGRPLGAGIVPPTSHYTPRVLLRLPRPLQSASQHDFNSLYILLGHLRTVKRPEESPPAGSTQWFAVWFNGAMSSLFFTFTCFGVCDDIGTSCCETSDCYLH